MPDPSPNPPSEAEESSVRRQVAEAVTRERRRLADALHRTASQSLTAAYYHAVVIAHQSPDNPARAEDIAGLPDMIHRAIGELREIAHEFRDPDPGTPPA